MFTCERCGAGLAPDAERCGSCGAASGLAGAALQSEPAHSPRVGAEATARAAIARHVAGVAIERVASRALLWGLLSTVLFCVPIPSGLAFLTFDRAKRLARQAGMAVPARARLGAVLGALSALGFVAVFVVAAGSVYLTRAHGNARKAALDAVVKRHSGSALLDHELACALAEKSLLEEGINRRVDASSYQDLACNGRLRIVGEEAELDDFKLRTAPYSEPIYVTICLRRGASWYVQSTGYTSCGLGR